MLACLITSRVSGSRREQLSQSEQHIASLETQLKEASNVIKSMKSTAASHSSHQHELEGLREKCMDQSEQIRVSYLFLIKKMLLLCLLSCSILLVSAWRSQ
jgi:chromosome segregation ATPase